MTSKSGAMQSTNRATRSDINLPRSKNEALTLLESTNILQPGKEISELENLVGVLTEFATSNTTVNLHTTSDYKQILMALGLIIRVMLAASSTMEQKVTQAVNNVIMTIKANLTRTINQEITKVREATEEATNRIREMAPQGTQSKPHQPANKKSSGPKLWSDIVVNEPMTHTNPRMVAQVVIAAKQVRMTLEGNQGIIKANVDNKTI